METLSGRCPFIVALLVMLFAAGSLPAVTNEELRRYGFGEHVTEALDEGRKLEPPKREPSRRAVPAPVLPGLTESKPIPQPTGFEGRTIAQAKPRRSQPHEGPTDHWRGKVAREEEQGFREVEDFIFTPRLVYPRLFSLSQKGLTGLAITISAEVPQKNFIHFRSGVDYTVYKRSFGQPLLDNQKITQLVFPFTYAFSATNDLEISINYSIVDEEARNFPLLTDFNTFGLQDVSGLTKYRFYDNPDSKVSFAVVAGMRNGIKRNVTRVGSSGIDYVASLNGTKRIRNFGVHGEFGAWFVNGLDRTNSGVPDVTFYGLGVDLQASEKLDLVLEMNGFDWQSFGNNTDATAGFKLKLSHNWLLDLNGSINLHSSTPQGYRGKLFGGLQLQF